MYSRWRIPTSVAHPQISGRYARQDQRLLTGISALTRVGPPGGLTTDRVPPATSTLSASPRKPRELASEAPPRPSSVTLTASRPAATLMRTVAALAPACFAILARHSEQKK